MGGTRANIKGCKYISWFKVVKLCILLLSKKKGIEPACVFYCSFPLSTYPIEHVFKRSKFNLYIFLFDIHGNKIWLKNWAWKINEQNLAWWPGTLCTILWKYGPPKLTRIVHLINVSLCQEETFKTKCPLYSITKFLSYFRIAQKTKRSLIVPQISSIFLQNPTTLSFLRKHCLKNDFESSELSLHHCQVDLSEVECLERFWNEG